MQLKTQLDEARQQLQTSKNAHLRHIEMMEVRIVAVTGTTRTKQVLHFFTL